MSKSITNVYSTYSWRAFWLKWSIFRSCFECFGSVDATKQKPKHFNAFSNVLTMQRAFDVNMLVFTNSFISSHFTFYHFGTVIVSIIVCVFLLSVSVDFIDTRFLKSRIKCLSLSSSPWVRRICISKLNPKPMSNGQHSTWRICLFDC